MNYAVDFEDGCVRLSQTDKNDQEITLVMKASEAHHLNQMLKEVNVPGVFEWVGLGLSLKILIGFYIGTWVSSYYKIDKQNYNEETYAASIAMSVNASVALTGGHKFVSTYRERVESILTQSSNKFITKEEQEHIFDQWPAAQELYRHQ